MTVECLQASTDSSPRTTRKTTTGAGRDRGTAAQLIAALMSPINGYWTYGGRGGGVEEEGGRRRPFVRDVFFRCCRIASPHKCTHRLTDWEPSLFVVMQSANLWGICRPSPLSHFSTRLLPPGSLPSGIAFPLPFFCLRPPREFFRPCSAWIDGHQPRMML